MAWLMDAPHVQPAFENWTIALSQLERRPRSFDCLISRLIHHVVKVSLDQLRQRFSDVEERRRRYEWKSEQPSRLVRHEVWRHAYLAHPYLLGAPTDRVAERMCHVFKNVMEVGDKGLLQPVPFTQTDEFMQLFTHLLEEYGSRAGGPPADVIERARRPLARYFEKGRPVGLSMFEAYPLPSAPILVKYGKREFLERMMRNGELRLANAALYNQLGHNDAVRDDETSRTFFIPTYRERLAGKTHTDVQGQRIEFGDDDIVLPLVFDDYYLFSLCEQIHYRMPTDFEADAAIVIRNPALFQQRLISSFLARCPGWVPRAGRVTYYDPYRDYSKFSIPEMAKHFGYAYQKEFRIVFQSVRRVATNLEPLSLSIGPMTEYADLVYA